MPKLLLENESPASPPVAHLARVANGIEIRVKEYNGSDWVLFILHDDGKFSSCGSLPKHLGLDIDLVGYPVVVKYSDRF
jgi:hypothetical protein